MIHGFLVEYLAVGPTPREIRKDLMSIIPIKPRRKFILVCTCLMWTNLGMAEDKTNCNSTAAHSPQEHLVVAECLARQGLWPEAEMQFRLAGQARSLLTEATVGHARSLFNLNQPFDALLEMENFLKANPDSVPALNLFATLTSVVLQDNNQAIKILERCTRLAPNDPEIWQHLGNLYLVKQLTAEALECFQQAGRLAPQDPLVSASLAYAYGQRKEISAANNEFAKALQLNKNTPVPNPLVLLLYAKFLAEQGNWAKAIPVYSEMLHQDAHSSEAYYGRAIAYEKMQDFVRAEADALNSLEARGNRKDACQLLLRIARAQKDQKKLEKYAAMILQVSSEEEKQQEEGRHLQLNLNKAEPLFTQGKYSEAAVYYEELLSRHPKFYEAYFALGVCYNQMGQPGKAESAFRKHLLLQPLSADGHAALGMLLSGQKLNEEALSELNRAMELDPQLLEARKALARLYVNSGKTEKALFILQQTPNPEGEKDDEYYVLLVNCYTRMNRLEEGRRICQQGLARFPKSDSLVQLSQSLGRASPPSEKTTP
jgi:tetratricopeptide (TPR) repeat protein